MRSVGDTSDIVEKEMYSFEDKAFRHLTLLPGKYRRSGARIYRESFVRRAAADQALLHRTDVPLRSAAGRRYRQFNQFGVEVMGSNDPSVDAEVITLAAELFKSIGLKRAYGENQYRRLQGLPP